MPKDPTVHYNPADTKGRTRCGFRLSHLKWSADINDCTCNSCIRFYEKDELAEALAPERTEIE